MIDTVRGRVAAEHLGNMNARVRGVTTEGFGMERACDACLPFNILHGESPVELIGTLSIHSDP